MGFQRNGARSFLHFAQKLCQLSRLPGFNGGLLRILGPEDTATLLAVWTPFCEAVDVLIALDDHFNKKDANDETTSGGSEDGTAG